MNRYSIYVLLAMVFILLGVPAAQGQEPPADAAYFLVGFEDPEHTFVIRLTAPTRIEEAQALLGKRLNIVSGIIVKEPAAYNPGWSYHLDPASIEFGEVAIEVCDASPTYVEEHLEEVGGAFLPDSYWCPWSSYLVEQIEPDPAGSVVYVPLVVR